MRFAVPEWLARPAAVLGTLAGLAGAGFIFWSAVTGGYWWAIWGLVCFVGAALLWHLADYAAAPSPLRTAPPGAP